MQDEQDGGMADKILLFIPTYNEKDNVERLYRGIRSLHPGLDFLFIDDHSPDGTGKIVDSLCAENSRVTAIHRSGKLGIGGAHLEGIGWAYDHGYDRLITMDCDFTHSPEYLKDFIRDGDVSDIVIGSRHVLPGSLADWDLYRKFVTQAGYLATKHLLRLPYDATGAYRLYRLDRIPRKLFTSVQSKQYGFFFESLYILHRNGCSIKQIPIILPSRTRGHSKMTARQMLRSAGQVLSMAWSSIIEPKRYASVNLRTFGVSINSPEWQANSVVLTKSRLAKLHRAIMIRLSDFFKLVDKKQKILDLGCGSGPFLSYFASKGYYNLCGIEPDVALIRNIPAGLPAEVKNCRAEAIDYPDGHFDVIFIYCVLHHLKGVEAYQAACREINRLLKPGGLVFIMEPGRYRLFLVIEAATRFLALCSRTFRAFAATMMEEEEDQHFFLRNHRAVSNSLLSQGFRPLVDDYFIYSWIFTAKKPNSSTCVIERGRFGSETKALDPNGPSFGQAL